MTPLAVFICSSEGLTFFKSFYVIFSCIFSFEKPRFHLRSIISKISIIYKNQIPSVFWMKGGVIQVLVKICCLWVYNGFEFVSKKIKKKICKWDNLLSGLIAKVKIVKLFNFSFPLVQIKKIWPIYLSHNNHCGSCISKELCSIHVNASVRSGKVCTYGRP